MKAPRCSSRRRLARIHDGTRGTRSSQRPRRTDRPCQRRQNRQRRCDPQRQPPGTSLHQTGGKANHARRRSTPRQTRASAAATYHAQRLRQRATGTANEVPRPASQSSVPSPAMPEGHHQVALTYMHPVLNKTTSVLNSEATRPYPRRQHADLTKMGAKDRRARNPWQQR